MTEPESNPYLEVGKPTSQGMELLRRVFTNPTGQVYAVNPREESPVTIAVVMARLSRKQGDMRQTYLEEFANTGAEHAEAVAERVVTGFGDDSVQRLATVQLVVEGASNIATKWLEWSRMTAYLEQSTRYIFFDRKIDGLYSYFIPFELDGHLREQYVHRMDEIFDLYSKMVREIAKQLRSETPEPEDRNERAAWMAATRAAACDAVRYVLPAATKATVGMVGNVQAIEQLILHLLSSPLEEVRVLGQLMLTESRKVVGAFLKRADKPEQGGARTAYRAKVRNDMKKLAIQWLNDDKWDPNVVGSTLVDYYPRSEFDLIPSMLYEHGHGLSLEDIKAQSVNWNHYERTKVIKTYLGTRYNRRQRPGRALENAHFTFEIVGDYGTFRDLQRHTVVDDLEWQPITPDYGYDVPDLVKKYGFEDDYRRCFNISGSLYDLLSKKGEFVAQYAVLMGNRMRYRFTFNLRALYHLLELRTGPTGHPGYRKICLQMYQQVKWVYPITTAGMIFINKGEDEALSRLGAEMATQYKLRQIDPTGQHLKNLERSDN